MKNSVYYRQSNNLKILRFLLNILHIFALPIQLNNENVPILFTIVISIAKKKLRMVTSSTGRTPKKAPKISSYKTELINLLNFYKNALYCLHLSGFKKNCLQFYDSKKHFYSLLPEFFSSQHFRSCLFTITITIV